MAAHDVMVGVDGSPESLNAVDFAAGEACSRGCGLRIVHASTWPYLDEPAQRPFTEADAESMRAQVDAIVEAAVDRAVARMPEARIAPLVVHGTPAEALARAAEDALVLIVGRRSGPVAKLRSTSVVGRAVLSATVPVVVVQGVSEPQTNVLVGVGDDSNTQEALRFAYAEADLRHTGVTAIHAWHGPVLAAHGVSDGARPAGSQRSNADATRVLAEQLAGWSEQFPGVPTRRTAPEGSAIDALVQASTYAQMVVIGRPHGVRGSALMHEVIRRALCPVAIAG